MTSNPSSMGCIVKIDLPNSSPNSWSRFSWGRLLCIFRCYRRTWGNEDSSFRITYFWAAIEIFFDRCRFRTGRTLSFLFAEQQLRPPATCSHWQKWFPKGYQARFSTPATSIVSIARAFGWFFRCLCFLSSLWWKWLDKEEIWLFQRSVDCIRLGLQTFSLILLNNYIAPSCICVSKIRDETRKFSGFMWPNHFHSHHHHKCFLRNKNNAGGT